MESEMVLKIYARKEVAERLRDAIDEYLVNDNRAEAVHRAINNILDALPLIDGLTLEEATDDED